MEERTMEIKDIGVDNIEITENSRIVIEHDDLSFLMQSLRDNGLLEPIGVIKEVGSDGKYKLVFGYRRLLAARKLGWRTIPSVIMDEKMEEVDVLAINTIENVQRKDISPLELGRMCYVLQKQGMTSHEIAIRLGTLKSRVENCIDLFQHTPSEYRKDVKFHEYGKDKKTGVTFNVANVINMTATESNLTKTQVKQLYDLAKEGKFNSSNARVMVSLLQNGMDFDKAIENLDKYARSELCVIYKKDEMKQKMDEQEVNQQKILKSILRGKIDGFKFIA